MSYAKYESYKDSGVDWLGKIPSDWDLLKVKNIFRLVMKFAPKNNDCELLSVYTDIGVKPRKELEERGNRATTTDGYLIVEKGDIVVNKLLAWMGAIGLSDYDGVTSPAYDVLKPKMPIEGIFYHLLFRSPQCTSELKRHSRGIMDMRLRLYFDKFGDVVVPYPNIEVQKKIVSFLAEKTAQIDQAIALKQQQIEKLNEYKQIVIQNAVTKGLNPNAPMKDSGVEWIGDIPEHWEIDKLKNILSSVSIKNHPNLPLLSITREKGVIERDIEDQESNHNFIPDDLSGYKLLKKGQFGMNKMKAWQGSYGVSDFTGIVSPAYYIFDINEKLNKNFFSLAIRSKFYVGYFASASDGVRIGQWDLNKTRMKEIPFIIPSIEEQKAIYEFSLTINQQVKDAIEKYQTQIDRLKEYKNILINQAVTGKIKI